MTNVANITDLWVSQTEPPILVLESQITALQGRKKKKKSYQVISEVYKTIPAITTVRIKPGTRPRIE